MKRGPKPRSFLETVRVLLSQLGNPIAGTGCIEWTGYKNNKGYGMISLNSKQRLAHRIAYMAAYGPIPDGVKVLHRCDNPPCCNPYHLFLGTQLDNMIDKVSKGRANTPRGTTHHRAKFTDSQIRYIRGSGKNAATLSREFKVSFTTISKILRRERWKHIL